MTHEEQLFSLLSEKVAEPTPNNEKDTLKGELEVRPGDNTEMLSDIKMPANAVSAGVLEQAKQDRVEQLKRLFPQGMGPGASAAKAQIGKLFNHGSYDSHAPMLKDEAVKVATLRQRVRKITGSV